MSPDDLESRLRAVEGSVRVLDGRVETLNNRLDTLGRLLDSLTPLRTEMALNTRQLQELDSDMGEIRDEFRERTDRLQSSIEAERDERRRVERERTTERKEDRKWLVIAMIMSAGLIISAMAFFYGLQ